MAKNKSQYDSTLNLPKTLFEMRAGLPKKEPAMLEDWEKNDLYNNLIKHNDGKPKFVLHDGPPYANGNIHMGTALNKIIKDIIIRDKNMEGFQAPYVPGFDTHGLPIELKALSSLGEKKKDISKLELRQICEKFATEHIDIMSDQFKRLGVIGDFEHPYLTLKPEFEARQIEIFGEIEHLLIHWCAKETLFKIIGQEGVDFQKHLHVNPFPYLSSGTFKGRETRTEACREYELAYQVTPDYVLTWLK